MVRFCFANAVNDHEAYPRALVSAPPRGWTYRPTTAEFDPTHGRPWVRFDTLPGELIHASSLIPTNGVPWILETDHIAFVVAQARASAEHMGKGVRLHDIECRIVEAITNPSCLGALVWSKASEAALEDLCKRHGAMPRRITVAYPGVVPPESAMHPQLCELSATLARLDEHAFKLLVVDGQEHRGVSKIAGRKNVSAAVECASRLRKIGARVELIVVGSTERIKIDQGWLHPLPVLQRGDLWRLYQAVDLLLFLSRQESFGYLPMEVMISRVCCLAATAPSLPAIPEIIKDRQTGVLVNFLEPRPFPELSSALDMEQVVTEIAGLMGAPQERQRLVDNASKRFEDAGLFSVATRNRILAERLLG